MSAAADDVGGFVEEIDVAKGVVWARLYIDGGEYEAEIPLAHFGDAELKPGALFVLREGGIELSTAVWTEEDLCEAKRKGRELHACLLPPPM